MTKFKLKYPSIKNKKIIQRESINRRKRHLKSYNLTEEQFNQIVLAQGNKCIICEKSFKNIKKYIDHNHKTGNIRAILCCSCNTGLGLFKENIILLNKAIEYLKKHS